MLFWRVPIRLSIGKTLSCEDAIMQAFGFFTLGILLVMLLGIEAVSSDPCSQFSDPARQSLCTSDNFPALLESGKE